MNTSSAQRRRKALQDWAIKYSGLKAQLFGDNLFVLFDEGSASAQAFNRMSSNETRRAGIEHYFLALGRVAEHRSAALNSDNRAVRKHGRRQTRAYLDHAREFRRTNGLVAVPL